MTSIETKYLRWLFNTLIEEFKMVDDWTKENIKEVLEKVYGRI